MEFNEVINEIKGKKWRKRGKWHHNTLSSEIYGEGESTATSRRLGYEFKRSRGIWLDTGETYDLTEEWLAIKKIVKEYYNKDNQYLLNYGTKCLNLGEKLISFSENICSKKKFSKLTNAELAKEYIRLITRIKDFMPFMFSMHLVDEFLTEEFKELFKHHYKNISEKELFEHELALSLPFKKIFVNQEKEDLMKIVINNGNLKEHIKKYSWMNAILLQKEPYTIDYYEKRVKSLRNVKEEFNNIKSEEKKLKNKQQEFMMEIEKNKEFYNIAKIVQIFGFLRSFRIDVPTIAYCNCWNLIEEIVSRLEINILDIKHLDSKEVNDSLLDNLDYKSIITERKKGSVSIMINEERYEIIDKDNIEQIKKNIVEEEAEETDFVKGSCAYPGKLIAPCKILHNLDDMNKVKKGDIIVVSMTDPNYVPVMEKAIAFITDFGGILCHAAILSREMKKPCIIGTKHATKTFKDGDILEVDAEKGVARKVK